MTRAEQYREHLRGFLRDKEEFNFLTGVEEFPDAELDNALKFAATEWNTTPPPIGYVSVETHPAPDILVLGAALWIATSDSLRSVRNAHAFSDGGVQTSEMSKVGNYSVVMGPLRAHYQQAISAYKTNANVMAGFGEVPGEYGW